jgi:hypothetical protein
MFENYPTFGKHCNCHLQDQYVMVEHFWKPYIGQAVGGKLYLMVLIGGTEETGPAVKLKMSTWLMKGFQEHPTITHSPRR